MNIPRLLDGIIALVLVEMIALTLYRRIAGKGMQLMEILSFLGAGLAMLAALRVIASGGSFVLFASAMLVSLCLHVMHISQRWR